MIGIHPAASSSWRARTRTAIAATGLVVALTAAGSWWQASPAQASARLTLTGQSGAVQMTTVHMTTVHMTTGPVNLASLYWILYKEDLDRIDRPDPGLINTMAGGRGLYVLERHVGGRKLPPGVILTENFFSTAGLQQAIANHAILPGVQVVADDLEDYASAPAPERLNPLPYLKQFGKTATAHGYRPILVPGRDLMRVPKAVCSQKLLNTSTISQAYLDCNMPSAAASTPMYVIQAAPVETNLPALQQLVQQGAAAARKANPHVNVFATLSVEPLGVPVSYQAVVQAARTILPYVNGIEMNSTPNTDDRVASFLNALSKG